MRKIKLCTGEIASIKNVMLESGRTNLEEGVDIYINGQYLNSLSGVYADEVTEDMIDLLLEY